ncbi:MAG: hypothetical protein ACRCST_08480 [Turicibacter sp.]
MPNTQYTYTKPSKQRVTHRSFVAQVQDQGLYIRHSHDVVVTQIEAQGLLVLQLSIQAALEAIFILFDAQDDEDVKNLQTIAQQINVIQQERQRVVIQCSDNIKIIQTEIEVTALVQAALELLTKITAKFLEI